jgi:mono/diheme cytochrome c family protein
VVIGALAASAAVAGCGSSTPLPSGAGAGDGKAIFVDSCGGCHTLEAAGTDGSNGPELTNIGLTWGEVSKQVYKGGGGMPSFDGELTDQQITAVSKFVDDNDGSN